MQTIPITAPPQPHLLTLGSTEDWPQGGRSSTSLGEGTFDYSRATLTSRAQGEGMFVFSATLAKPGGCELDDSGTWLAAGNEPD